jgi:hypothetical protein
MMVVECPLTLALQPLMESSVRSSVVAFEHETVTMSTVVLAKRQGNEVEKKGRVEGS